MTLLSSPPLVILLLLMFAYLGLSVAYGCLIGGQRFARVWVPRNALAFVFGVFLVEATIRTLSPVVFLLAGLVMWVTGSVCRSAARDFGEDRTSSVLTRWYSALYPEVSSLATVRDKVRAVHAARWRLVGDGRTMALLVSWYLIPWIAMHAALRVVVPDLGSATDFVVAVTVLGSLFVGMHFVFRSPIRAHIRDFIREQEDDRAAQADSEVTAPSEDGDGAAERVESDNERHAH